MTDPSQWGFETTQVHAGQVPDSATGARALPIYQTTSYVFNDTAHAANLFALKEFGNIYTRIMNPTQDAVEQRIAALEGGLAALLVSSGQAATTIGLLNIAESGDHIVSSSALYGGTVNLLKYTFKKLGIDVTFIDDQDDLEAWRAAVRPNTKAFFAETIANPKAIVLDIAGVAGVAHEAGVPLVVDNTIATPYLIRPLEHGADVVIHSATKYLGGHGTSIAGVIVDGGTFDYGQDPEKFPNYNTPEESYHGLVFARDLGVGGGLGANLAYILKARVQLLRDLGSAISPFNAFLIAQGVETLSLRVERHIENARKVAEPTSRRTRRWRRCAGPRSTAAPARRWPTSTPPRVPARCSRSRSPAGSRPGSASSRGCRCTATWPTSATCARSRSTRHPRRTARAATRTGSPPA